MFSEVGVEEDFANLQEVTGVFINNEQIDMENVVSNN